MVFSRARILVLGLALVAIVVALSGCTESGYSEDLRYPARTDPIVKKSEGELDHPDQPGQLPLLTLPTAAEMKLPPFDGFKELLDPSKANPQKRKDLDGYLVKMFGTPAKPKVQGLNPEGEQALAEAKTELQLDDATLARGSQIYRIQCLHCHGLPGDGHGPTAFWVNPHPRDYRQGIFKFSSVDVTKVPDAKPRRDDLLRTLRIGIDGSSMPAFGLLSDRDLEDLVSYVIHLSLRGQFEFIVLQDLIGGTDTFSEDVTPDVLLKTLAVDRWLASQKPEAMIKPEKHDYKTEEELAQGIKRGWAAFKETTGGTGCLACHTDYGRQAKFRYDVWGTLNRPANLTSNMYRGGRTPLDLYYRLYSGIPGTAMPAFSGSSLDGQRAKYEKSGGKEGLKSAWDLVEFVRVLPYPAMREKYGIHIDRVD